jgi:acyl-CoA thioester hydrolase
VRLAFDPPLDPATYAFRHDVRVRFAETDAMGIVHHASYLPYLEEARVAYLRAIGHPYHEVRAAGADFAVLEVFVRYLQPLRFDEIVRVHLLLAVASRATFQMGYLLEVDGQARATAVTVHGCVDPTGRPVRMPSWLSEMAQTTG